MKLFDEDYLMSYYMIIQIFYQIANSESKHKDMVKARSIIQRIFVRDLYKLCAKAKSIKPAGKVT